MVAPPVPWHGTNKGGYLISPTSFLRVESSNAPSDQYELIARNHESKMYPVYDSLNILAACPWKINNKLLDMLIQVFNENGNEELDVPQPADLGPAYPIPPKY